MGWNIQSHIFKGSGNHGNPGPFSITFVVFLLVFQLLKLPHPTSGSSLDISKREQQLIQIIEKHAMSLDFRKFDHDPVMVQSSTDSEYTKSRQSKDVLFYKKNPDSGKDAIALSSAENQFAIPTPRGNLKRQFILLKKSPLAVDDGGASDVPYFGSFVYVRNLLANDDAKKSVFEVSGTKTVIEWDIWETRPKGFYAGWETCDFTNLFTCESFYEMIDRADQELASDGGVEKDKPKGGATTKKSRRKRAAAAPQPWPKLTPIVSEEGYNPADFNDLYLDLDLHREEHIRHPMRRPRPKKNVTKKATKKPKRKKRAMGDGQDVVAEMEMEEDSDQSLNRVKRHIGFSEASKGVESASGGSAKKAKKKKKSGSKYGGEAEGGAEVSASADLGVGMGGGMMASIKGSVKGFAKSPNLLKKIKDTPGGMAKLNPMAEAFANVDVSAAIAASASVDASVSANVDVGASVAGYANMRSMGSGALVGLGIGAEVFAGASAAGGSPLEALEASVGVSASASASAGFGRMFDGDAEAAVGASVSASAFANVQGRAFGSADAGVGIAAGVSGRLGGSNPLGAIASVVGNANPLTAIAGGGVSATAMASVGGNFGANLQGIIAGNAQVGVGGNAVMGALTSIGGALSGGKGGPLSSILGGENPLVAVTQVAGALGNINGLIGGTLGDVAIGSVAGAVSVMLSGSCGAVGLLGNLMAGGLGAAASVRALLGPAEAVMENVNGRIKELSVDISANIIGTLEISGEGGMTDCFGDIVSSILTSGGDAVGPIAMAGKILGPICGALAPATAIVTAANGIVTGLPMIGAAMGQSIISSLPVDTLNVGGMLSSLGLGPILSTVTGLADSIVAVGESLVSAVDMLGNGLIDGAAEVLIKMGVPPEIAHLAAMGAHLTFNTLYLVVKGHALGIRLSVDLAGAVLNGGTGRGSGSGPSDGSFATWQKWVNNDGVTSNAYLGFGFVYPGAAEGKSFFIPDYSLVRCVYKAEGGVKVEGYFHPSTTPDGNSFFFADDPAKMEALAGKVGVMTPTSYKQPHRDASYGIHGEVSADGFFKSASNPKFGVFNPADVRNVSNYWLPPGTETKGPQRPTMTPDGMPVIYGMLFPGMLESPHIFVADGDMLTGFFVPFGNNPKMKETPHGVFIPGRAGHAKFSLEDTDEFKDAKEARGAFLPDAMNLEGGISGKLVRTDNSSTFNFIIDRPSVDYAFIKGHISTNMIWSTFLSAEEWKYTPPPVPPPEGVEDPKKEKASRRKRNVANLEVSATEVFGIKVATQRCQCFLPENYDIEGTIVVVDKQTKYKPMHGSIVAGKPNSPWKLTIIKRDESDPKIEKPAVCLFVPKGYTKEDALIGVMLLNADQKAGEIQISEKQKQAEHFWTEDQELWTPIGFLEFAKTKKKPEVQEPKPEETKKEQNTSVPGVRKARADSPFKAPNYYYGPLYENGSAEAEENIMKDAPHQYHYGFYFINGGNYLFFPEQGGKCTFTPEGKGPEKCTFTPSKPDKPGSAKFENEGAVAEGTAGILKSVDIKGEEATEGLQATYNKVFEFKEGVDIMPGWSLATVAVEEGAEADHKEEKYSLIDIGGGLKAVVVQSPAALEDANNPLFQKFLHYKAHRDGNVNPWGQVLVFDPIQRKGGGDGKLGVGDTTDAMLSAPNLTPSLMSTFKINNWAWPTARVNGLGQIEAKGHTGLSSMQPVMVGEKRNIVNMMDFRMWLMRRYRCKRAPGEGDKQITILTPRMAEGYIEVTNPSKFKQEYFDEVKKSAESVVMPYEEGVFGFFTKMFNLDGDNMQEYYGQRRKSNPSPQQVNRRRKRSPKKKKGEAAAAEEGGGGGAKAKAGGQSQAFNNDAPFGEWGGAELCDEIDLPDFAVAQIEEDQGSGMDLGLSLIEKEGAKMPWPALASKLLGRVHKKKKKAPGQVLDNMGTTDLLSLNIQIVAGMVVQKKKTNTESGEDTKDAKGKKEAKEEKEASNENESRRKRSSRKRRRRAAEKKKEEEDEDNPGENLPGWRTQYKPQPWKDKVTVSADGLIFYGLGNCRQEKIPDPKLLESKDAAKIVDYYMKVLRIDCRPKRRPKMMDLFNDRLLVLSDDRKYFEIMKENALFHTQRLTPREIIKISLAFEMSAFTKSYHKLRTSGGFPTKGFLESDGTKISRTIGFFTEMSLYYVQRARRVSPPHSVRLTRNMLRTLRTVLTKMHQDVILLEKHCGSDCPTDLEVTKNDKFTVMALVQFIIHGLGPVEKNTEDVRAAFDKFIDINKKAIQERVEEFDRQYPIKPKKTEE